MKKLKIAICGGPSSGKTTTASDLVSILKKGYGVDAFHVTEYMTDFLHKYRREPAITDQIISFFEQKERELSAVRSHDVVVCDSPLFLQYIYALMINDGSATNNRVVSFLYDKVLHHINDGNYDIILFREIQPYKQNKIRFYDEATAKQIQNRIKDFLVMHRISYIDATNANNDDIVKKVMEYNA